MTSQPRPNKGGFHLLEAPGRHRPVPEGEGWGGGLEEEAAFIWKTGKMKLLRVHNDIKTHPIKPSNIVGGSTSEAVSCFWTLWTRLMSPSEDSKTGPNNDALALALAWTIISLLVTCCCFDFPPNR